MTGQRVGYVRVSTLDQNTERQLVGLKLDKTFTDKASGKDTQRPELTQMIGYVREGDTVVVHSMDRLARNLDDLRSLVRTLTGKGARIEFVKESLTFTADATPMAQLLLNVMGSFAEFERALIRERQREGVTLAKAKGVYKGRKPALTAEKVSLLRERVAAGAKKAALARELKVSRITVHRYLRDPSHGAPISGKAVTPPDATIVLTLQMEIFGTGNRARKKQLVDDIEDWILSRYKVETICRGIHYRLTVRYTSATDLEGRMADLWFEIETRAEAYRCTVQGDVRDEQDRTWGDGTVKRHPEWYTDLSLQNGTSNA
jgi:DNA invertase Pin-like site-specific DNA recombinase